MHYNFTTLQPNFFESNFSLKHYKFTTIQYKVFLQHYNTSRLQLYNITTLQSIFHYNTTRLQIYNITKYFSWLQARHALQAPYITTLQHYKQISLKVFFMTTLQDYNFTYLFEKYLSLKARLWKYIYAWREGFKHYSFTTFQPNLFEKYLQLQHYKITIALLEIYLCSKGGSSQHYNFTTFQPNL